MSSTAVVTAVRLIQLLNYHVQSCTSHTTGQAQQVRRHTDVKGLRATLNTTPPQLLNAISPYSHSQKQRTAKHGSGNGNDRHTRTHTLTLHTHPRALLSPSTIRLYDSVRCYKAVLHCYDRDLTSMLWTASSRHWCCCWRRCAGAWPNVSEIRAKSPATAPILPRRPADFPARSLPFTALPGPWVAPWTPARHTPTHSPPSPC